MKPKKRERDRHFSDDLPSDNYDFKEAPIESLEALDKYVQQSPAVQRVLNDSYATKDIAELRQQTRRKQQKLLRKVMQAASQVLTDRQFQIFTLRFIFNLTEEEVAERLTRDFIGRPRLDKQTKRATLGKPISQAYVSQSLHRITEKIQEALRLKANHKPT